MLCIIGVQNANGAVGCLIEYNNPNYGRIYTTVLGDVDFYSSKYKEYNLSGAYTVKSYASPVPCGETNAGSISSYSQSGYNGCWVNTYLNATNNQDNVQYGTWVQFNVITQCPIDDFLPCFSIFSAIVALIVLRRSCLDNVYSRLVL